MNAEISHTGSPQKAARGWDERAARAHLLIRKVPLYTVPRDYVRLFPLPKTRPGASPPKSRIWSDCFHPIKPGWEVQGHPETSDIITPRLLGRVGFRSGNGSSWSSSQGAFAEHSRQLLLKPFLVSQLPARLFHSWSRRYLFTRKKASFLRPRQPLPVLLPLPGIASLWIEMLVSSPVWNS